MVQSPTHISTAKRSLWQASLAVSTLLPLFMTGAAGCLVFDEPLHEQDGETASSASKLAFTDVCTIDDATLITESTSVVLDFTEYVSSGLGYPKCVAKQYQGPDTFFVIDAKAGERWTLSAAPQTIDHDVSIVVLEGDSCIPSSCVSVRDRCGSGFDEEHAFVAKEDALYVITVDGLDPNISGMVTVSASKSICGNGIVEPGETCDGAENCDSFCRREIYSGTVAEGEPNDIFTGVDMIGVPGQGGEVTITGAVGGPCDEDHYAFIVPEGASVTVRMLSPGGAPCPADTPEIALPLVDFLAAGGPLPIGAGKVDAEHGGCPYFEASGLDPDFEFTRNLPASEYHLIVNAFETPSAVPYELQFEILPNTP